MKTNVAAVNTNKTHEGAPASPDPKPIEMLRRSVLACMLWEDQFYEDGVAIAERIKTLARQVPVKDLAALCVEARTLANLRHVPLLLLTVLIERARGTGNQSYLVAGAIANTIQRADELAELVALYWKDGKRPLSKQMKLGLARAFTKFDAYALAKYDRAEAIRLRDVLFMVHAKPIHAEQAAMWKQLVDGTLPTPDTWEVGLSAGDNKRETFERLLRDGHMGYLALLRNLRNMEQAGVDRALIVSALLARKGAHRVLPFRYVAAAKAAPTYEAAIDEAFVQSLRQAPKLPGKTVVVLDVSGSMYSGAVSAKSDMDRAYAACALGAILRERCEDARIYATAGDDGRRVHATQLVPARHGMALVDAIYGMCHPLGGGGIFLNQVCKFLAEKEGTADRMIVITDEADCGNARGDSPLDAVPIAPRAYMLNVASYRNGIGYGKWTHITGFSEAVVAFIEASETSAQ